MSYKTRKLVFQVTEQSTKMGKEEEYEYPFYTKVFCWRAFVHQTRSPPCSWIMRQFERLDIVQHELSAELNSCWHKQTGFLNHPAKELMQRRNSTNSSFSGNTKLGRKGKRSQKLNNTISGLRNNLPVIWRLLNILSYCSPVFSLAFCLLKSGHLVPK